MTTAVHVLELFRAEAGFDGWGVLLDDGSFYVSEGYPKYLHAKPAWKNGDNWFFLPEGWSYEPRVGWFITKKNYYCVRNRTEYWVTEVSYPECPGKSMLVDNVVDAFKLAEKWISELEEDIDKKS